VDLLAKPRLVPMIAVMAKIRSALGVVQKSRTNWLDVGLGLPGLKSKAAYAPAE